MSLAAQRIAAAAPRSVGPWPHRAADDGAGAADAARRGCAPAGLPTGTALWRGVVWCGVVWCGVVWCGFQLHCIPAHVNNYVGSGPLVAETQFSS